MTDTHVHLDDARYGEAERQEILDNLERDGLTAVINAACDLTSMRAGARLAERCSKVFSPWAVIRTTRKTTTTLLKGKSCALRKSQGCGDGESRS